MLLNNQTIQSKKIFLFELKKKMLLKSMRIDDNSEFSKFVREWFTKGINSIDTVVCLNDLEFTDYQHSYMIRSYLFYELLSIYKSKFVIRTVYDMFGCMVNFMDDILIFLNQLILYRNAQNSVLNLKDIVTIYDTYINSKKEQSVLDTIDSFVYMKSNLISLSEFKSCS